MKASLGAQKQQILSDIRSLAAEKYKKKGFLDTSDVEEMKARAAEHGDVGRSAAADLNFIREYYADVMTSDAAQSLDGFLGGWVSNQIRRNMQRQKDKVREKKAEAQLEDRDLHYENLTDDRDEFRVDRHESGDSREQLNERMQKMDVDAKQRVLIAQFFNRHPDD